VRTERLARPGRQAIRVINGNGILLVATAVQTELPGGKEALEAMGCRASLVATVELLSMTLGLGCGPELLRVWWLRLTAEKEALVVPQEMEVREGRGAKELRGQPNAEEPTPDQLDHREARDEWDSRGPMVRMGRLSTTRQVVPRRQQRDRWFLEDIPMGKSIVTTRLPARPPSFLSFFASILADF